MHHSLSFNSADYVHISGPRPIHFDKHKVAQKCTSVKISVVGRTATPFDV